MILNGKLQLFLCDVPEEEAGNEAESSVELPGEVLQHDDLPDMLRKVRKQLSTEYGFPPYIIFHDSTLRQMAEKLPRTAEEMLSISGVSANKMEKYGEHFLNVIRNYHPETKMKNIQVEDALSEAGLVAYMNELKEKKLKFSATVVAKVLTGSVAKPYAEIAARVSFKGLLYGRLSYKEVLEKIRLFYSLHEREYKMQQLRLSPVDRERLDKRVRTEAFFQPPFFNHLDQQLEDHIRLLVQTIPMKKDESGLSDVVKKLRGSYHRSHEPWTFEEEELLRRTVKKCNDLQRITCIFGRSPNSVLAMTTKWIDEIMDPGLATAG